MSKEKPLKETIVCEWGSPSICGSHFATVREATLHMREHLLLYRIPNAQVTYQCTWRECVWSTQDVAEFHRHCLFHPFHTYLKYLGHEYKELKQLPKCGLDSSMSNILPSFDKELKCLWSRGNCGKTFDCVSDFYDHMGTHTSSSSMFECQWSGEPSSRDPVPTCPIVIITINILCQKWSKLPNKLKQGCKHTLMV